MMMCIIIILIFYYFSEWVVDHNSQNFVRQIQKIVCAVVAEEEESKQSVLEPTRRSLKPMCPITSVHSLSFTSLF